MSGPWLPDVLFWAFGSGSVVAAIQVFRTDSMVRAAFWLLASFGGVAAILILLGLQFLGFILLLMMAGEMAIMAVFMVMFMMNPAGLNPMMMVHQHRLSLTAGGVGFFLLAAVAVFGSFPARGANLDASPVAELGRELLGESMLIFETAGVALLATMIGAIAVAGARGRFGDAQEESVEPELRPDAVEATPADGAEGTVVES